MARINLDIAAEINIDLLQLHSYDVMVDFVQDNEDETPVAIQGIIKLTATNVLSGEVIEIEEGEGLTKNGNRITLRNEVVNNEFTKGTWLYNVRSDLDTGFSIPYIRGKIISS